MQKIKNKARPRTYVIVVPCLRCGYLTANLKKECTKCLDKRKKTCR